MGPSPVQDVREDLDPTTNFLRRHRREAELETFPPKPSPPLAAQGRDFHVLLARGTDHGRAT